MGFRFLTFADVFACVVHVFGEVQITSIAQGFEDWLDEYGELPGQKNCAQMYFIKYELLMGRAAEA